MANPQEDRTTIFVSRTDYDLPDDLPQGLVRYQSMREIGRGGNAILRSAFDSLIGRMVAIKTLQPDVLTNRRERRRFLREARVTAQLQHPNTVPVYDMGIDDEEGPYFTMKRISGENFFEILKRIAQGDNETAEEFTIARKIEIAIGACQALAYAHARGVIHRDVKPENIWVGNFGEVVLLDWGAAKVWGQPDDVVTLPPEIAHAEDDRLQSLTLAGQRPGTPLYMSPEQISRRGSLDERADIFSAGVVMYEMLTFSEPFRGQTIEETFDNVANYTPPAPSELRQDWGIPKALDKIVMRAMAKKPGDRFGDMRELVAALQAVGE